MRGRGGGPQSSCECLYMLIMLILLPRKERKPIPSTSRTSSTNPSLDCRHLHQTIDHPPSPPVTNTHHSVFSSPCTATTSTSTCTYIMHIKDIGRFVHPAVFLSAFLTATRLSLSFARDPPPPPLLVPDCVWSRAFPSHPLPTPLPLFRPPLPPPPPLTRPKRREGLTQGWQGQIADEGVRLGPNTRLCQGGNPSMLRHRGASPGAMEDGPDD